MARLLQKLSLFEKIFFPLMSIMFIFLIQYSIAPIQKLREYNRILDSDSLFSLKYSKAIDHQDITPLVRDKSFREALLDLAAKDSIQLSVNLADSTVCLYINGVRIHRSKITSFRKDKFLNKMPNRLYAKILSKGLNIDSHFATIVKEPIVIRQAPKDTVEAALNIWQPDTLIQNPAFLQLNIDHGIHLIFEQDKNPSSLDQWVRFRFYSRLWINQIFTAIKHFLQLKNQEYLPTITIELPVDDLRAIFRALPDQASVAIRL